MIKRLVLPLQFTKKQNFLETYLVGTFLASMCSLMTLHGDEYISLESTPFKEELKPNIEAPTPAPWLTGPLIAPTGTAIPYGNFLIQYYTFYTTYNGTYNKDWRPTSASHNFYSLNSQVFLFFGLTPWCDINIIPQVFYNRTSNQHSWEFGDLTTGLDFQLLAADYTPYFPGIKFAVREVFPTGPFQRLNPKKLLTDQTGAGTFATQFNLVLYKMFHLSGFHWLTMTASAQYQVNTQVDVSGFNTYGGGHDTHGKVSPGNTFQGILSFEYKFNKRWGITLDNIYTHTNKTEFCGTSTESVGLPSNEQISFAPAIEYNFSSQLGIIGGCWFSALGRNSTVFRSGVVNLLYTY